MDNLNQTIDMIKASYASGGSAVGPDVAKDFNLALTLVPYNLEAGARLLFPVLSPLRNMIPRTKGRGTARQFKAITGINTGNSNIFAQEGFQGQQVITQETDVTVPYRSMGLYDAVTLEAQIQGEGQVDARALAAANLLRAFMIQEEQAILFGQGPAVTGASAGGTGVSIGGLVGTAPSCTATQAGTGGALAAATYNIKQSIVTGMGESPVQAASTDIVVASGTTNSITVTPVPVAGQTNLSFNIYIRKSTDGAGAYTKFSTTGAPFVYTTYALGTVTPNATDTSALLKFSGTAANQTQGAAYNGILPQLMASQSGATVTALNGALSSMSTFDAQVKSMWDTARADPDTVYANSKEVVTITGLTIGAGTPYYLVVKDQDGATGGYRVSRLVNKVTGTEMKLDVHPFLTQGTMLILSTKMPQWYPGSDIPSVWAMDLPLDYTQLDYFPTQPRWPFEIRAIGALLLYLPAVQGVITGIS